MGYSAHEPPPSRSTNRGSDGVAQLVDQTPNRFKLSSFSPWPFSEFNFCPVNRHCNIIFFSLLDVHVLPLILCWGLFWKAAGWLTMLTR